MLTLDRAAERGAAWGPCRFPTLTPHCAVESSPLGGSLARRALTALLIAVALAGAASFGDGAYLLGKASAGQWLLHRAWARARATGESIKPWPWADTYPVARLTAPRLGADVLVLAGASGRTLAWGPGHLDGSAPLGDEGNAVVSAHRDTHFRFLRDIAIGDELVVELADGTQRHYRVRERYVADVRTLRVPRTAAVPTLTLVTCYPLDAIVPGGPLRLVVVAEGAAGPRFST